MSTNRVVLLMLNIVAGALLITGVAVKTPTVAHSQDQSFRLINIERRLDQVQSRLDFIERAQQSQGLNNISSANVSTQVVLDLQRQQLALADQVVTMQRRMLEMQKTIDQLAERGSQPKPTPEKKEPTKPNTKQKTPS
jgi:hypothetical protein